MNRFKSLLAILILPVVIGAALPASAAYAWSPFASVDCSGKADKSTVCNDKDASDNPISGADGVIMDVVDLIALVAGIAAVIIIILAGLRMITSSGSSEDVAGARRALIYASVGIVIVIASRTIVAFIISKI